MGLLQLSLYYLASSEGFKKESFTFFRSSTINSSLQIYYSKYDLEAINFDVFNDQRLFQENEVKDAGIKIDTRFVIGRKIDFFAGYQILERGKI